MSFRRVAVIMAGGSGERFWPVSTRERPKQFLRLTRPDKSLLQEAVDRAASLVGTDNTIIATGRHLAQKSAEECPGLTVDNVLAEPAKRNTTGCLVWVAANLIARHPDTWPQISIAVLTADHRIFPVAGFHQTVSTALDVAEETGGLVTIGIPPARPETGYGYVELGEPHGAARQARSFREKPDLATAEEYVRSGQYLWNSGMFFWTLAAFVSEMEAAQPAATALLRKIAGLLADGKHEAAAEAFEELEGVSIDYALMERASKVFVVPAEFEWDDMGAWDALRRSYEGDEADNVAFGSAQFLDSANCVVYNETDGQEVRLMGVEGLVVVVTGGTVMVCPADMAQDVRRLASS
ncbi:MAG: mannose-1-phosphate guanylyltransferase [Armatimonadetes bacterium]|nr:mannose-1-phosphate guanylyltransferase [Armatimonadota bacterium]